MRPQGGKKGPKGAPRLDPNRSHGRMAWVRVDPIPGDPPSPIPSHQPVQGRGRGETGVEVKGEGQAGRGARRQEGRQWGRGGEAERPSRPSRMQASHRTYRPPSNPTPTRTTSQPDNQTPPNQPTHTSPHPKPTTPNPKGPTPPLHLAVLKPSQRSTYAEQTGWLDGWVAVGWVCEGEVEAAS